MTQILSLCTCSIKMVHYNSPMTIYFKGRVSRLHLILHKICIKFPKIQFKFFHRHQIRYRLCKRPRFIPFICLILKWQQTKAPWPFISEVVVAGWVHQFLHWNCIQIRKSELLLCQWNQICCRRGKWHRFFPFIRVLLNWRIT